MTYGDLQSVVLYRDVGRNRWRWAIYDTEGLWDGFFPELTSEDDFAEAAGRLDRHLRSTGSKRVA